MTTMYFNVKTGIQTGNVVIDAASGNINNIGNITLVGGTSADLGNAATANYFVGNGALLTSITGANVTGYVPNATAANTAGSATTAGTVTTAAQPNITSLGTLSGLSVTGNIFAPAIVQNASTYDTRISLNSAAGIVEITSNGYSTKFGPAGIIELGGASQITGGTFGGSGITLGGSQTDIFQNRGGNVTVQTGTGGSIAKTWTFENGGNLSAPGKITSAGLVSNSTVDFTTASNVSLGNISNLHIDGGAAGYVLQTDGSGTLTFASAGSTGIAGTNTQVQFNDNGSFGASSAFTFDKGTNTLSVTNFAGNGAGFTFIAGSNVSGNVDSAIQSNYANTANSVAGANVSGNVDSAIQSNYANTANSVAGANVSGNVDYAITSNWANTANSISGANVSGNVDFAVTSNWANVANSVAGANVSGNVDYAITSNWANTANSVAGANVTGQVGNALIAGTVYTNAQPNITSVGTLLGLSVTGNLDITGNINATGNLNYSNVNDLVVGDPLIYLGANNTGNLYDLGFVASYNDGTYYHTGLARDATDGVWKLFDGVVAEPTTVIDFANGTYPAFKSGSFTSTGNIVGVNANLGNLVIANYFSGDGSLLTNINGSNIGNVGNANFSNTAGTVTTNAQPNITSVGTLSSLSVTGNVSGNYFIGNGARLTSITGANVTGYVPLATAANTATSATTAGTVTTAAQPNITSVGTLSSLSVTGNVGAGNIKSDNLLYANGSPYVFTTSAAGSNTQVQFNDSNSFAGSAAFTFNKGTNTLSATNFAGNGALLTNITGANVTGYVPLATAANTAGTVTTAAQPNITSVGTLSSLAVSGNLTAGNANVTGTLSVGSIATSGTGSGNISGADYIAANYFSGNGSLLTSITGSNVTGNVTYAITSNWANVANSVSGTNVSGNVTYAITSNWANVANSVLGTNVSGNVTSAVQSHYANIANSVSGSNVTGQVGNALIAGTVYTAAQPNITSVGTLSNLSVTGTVTTGSVKLTTGLTSNRSNVSVTTNTVIDQFTPSTYRTAKYIISASGDHGYQSVETLMVHDGSSAYITIYGSVCSNVSADIIDLSSNVNGVSGNVTLYATSASPNAKVNVVVTYITT